MTINGVSELPRVYVHTINMVAAAVHMMDLLDAISSSSA